MKTLFSSAFASLVLLASSAIADERAFLGVSTAPAEGGRGLLVQEVTEGSGAEKAGIREGDVILRFAGKKPKDFDALAAAVRARKVGDKVDVVVLRDGEDQTLQVVLGKAPGETEEMEEVGDQEAKEKAEESPGFLVETEEGEQKGAWLGIQHRTDEEGNLTIQEVIPGSPAKKAGLQKGDKILRFNGEPGSEIAQTIAACEPGQKVEVTVRRGEEEKTVTVTLAKKSARTLLEPRLRVEPGRRRLHVETPRIEIPETRGFRAPTALRIERDDERMKEVLEEVRSLRKEVAQLREMIEKLASRER